MSARLLEADSVSHAFGSRSVLREVSLGLCAGQLLVVLGPNGAGKTTLIRILSGVLAPQGGSVRLLGEALAGRPRREVARRLAVVPQEWRVEFPFRVRELVAMGRAPRLGALGREGPTDRAQVEDALVRLGLLPVAERVHATLSGGEKQRVVLARALAQEAPVLLLDEPTAHMDLGHRVHTFEWLRAWLAERPAERGALVVTHDLALAARFADEVALLDGGRLVAVGPPAAVLTRERVASVYRVDAEILEGEGGRPLVFAVRSRIRYIATPDEPDR